MTAPSCVYSAVAHDVYAQFFLHRIKRAAQILGLASQGLSQIVKEQVYGISVPRLSAKNKKPGALFSAPGLWGVAWVGEV